METNELKNELLAEQIKNFILLFEELDEEKQLILLNEIIKAKLKKIQRNRQVFKQMAEMASQEEFQQSQEIKNDLNNAGKKYFK